MSTVSTLSSRLCALLDIITGTKEIVKLKRLQLKFSLHGVKCIICGSRGEGLENNSSDFDYMLCDERFLITQHDELCENDNMKLRMIYDTHHRGSVLLESMNVGELADLSDMYKGRCFLSNDKFKIDKARPLSVCGLFSPSFNGPCINPSVKGSLGYDVDFCCVIRCNEWPRIAQEFNQRRRIFEWPPRAVINHISNDGCYCVPIGDHISEHTRLQWRISFAHAEVKLVHTFSHVALKVYALLKTVYGDLLNKILDDSDGKPLLCSYFLKTIMFYVKENSPLSIWTENNMLNCFFLCFNFLIQSVEKGMLCHYFIPSNNLFRRRIHGKNRHTLLEYLYTLRRKGVGILLECPTLHPLLDLAYSDHSPPLPPVVSEYHYDTCITGNLNTGLLGEKSISMSLIHYLCLYSNLHDDGTMYMLLCLLQTFLIDKSSELFASTVESTLDNKQIYHRRRTCRRYLLAAAQLDASRGWLTLATYHYLLGQHRLARTISQRVIQSIKPWTIIYGRCKDENAYMQRFCGQGISILTKMRQAFSHLYVVNLNTHYFSPTEIFPEVTFDMGVRNVFYPVHIQPQVYAEFLSFLCCHQMSDRSGQHMALSHLLALQYDDIQGIYSSNVDKPNYILYHLIGICYEIIGDYQNAEESYLASTRKDHLLAPVARRRATNLREFLERFH